MGNHPIEERTLTDPELNQLLRDAVEELARRYGFEEFPEVTPGATYCVALADNGHACACGALQSTEENGLGEIKRIFTQPQFRGHGYARAMMKRMEELARSKGFTRLRLQTGNRQPEAIELYTATGWTQCEAYGEYVGDTFSVCFMRNL
ncbi:GNAT family N-acetyltransferase [Bifidobacterium tibiigranuli]|jgi:GNAT superfamily N-acetyltransferase|uniref:GNAT family N-acetyltransferase n=1 Tax=Bifidobacterium tibiigranuli TaxID=2172043 RepID=A0A5N6RZL2_9BIFI|nr:GNAT family N-acetyltransferase [Bifidobacterium tibiigranuli]KAE8126758.1 GNAT family N-acetyltransferase [Bifidobacterium tibiigranuli]KAE8126841.1 GNAT family N-acetyltransferase [Bifidobacterium tibiigranuli]MCI1673093.1 GNAT family N-acetyltransferase [Bifidobacterium tibiigranuli]MCI1713193.1 GNAT family N-acetyltransferase [Bifidobacterium tibiigranuli]MCI1834847.1 GNAT family N-acetyltransferase [Bifidobacterium tibiigranuli]